MTTYYADTSALARAYLVDEVRHEECRRLLLESDLPVVTSELTRLEFISAVMAATRAGRIGEAAPLMNSFDVACSEDGPLALISFDPDRILPVADRLLRAHRLRTLDALHLAVALIDLPSLAPDGDAVFVSEDGDQRRAALAEGLTLN